MPQPYNYSIRQPDVSDYFSAFTAGRKEKLDEEQDVRNTALAKYLPGALAGDKTARAQALAAGNPEQQIALSQHFAKMDDQTLARTKEQQAQVAAAAVAATTPEAWVQVNALAKSLNPNAPDIPFEQRDMVIARGMSTADLLNQEWKKREYALDQSRTKAQNAASYASADASRANAAFVRGGKGMGGGEATLAPETVDFMADQYLAGDTSVMTNLGRGVQGARNIVAIREAIAKKVRAAGGTARDVATAIGEFQGFKAGSRTLGTRTANMGMAVNEAYSMADLVTEASKDVSRTGFIPVNSALQAFQRNSGDPKVVKFGAALNSFINAYARAVAPTGAGPTVSDKEHAREMLSTAFSDEQVTAVVDQLKMEMQAARRAPGQTREEVRGLVGREPAEATPPAGRIKYDSSGKRLP